jgi:hypothetical protein
VDGEPTHRALCIERGNSSSLASGYTYARWLLLAVNFPERRNSDVGETPYRAGPDGPGDAEGQRPIAGDYAEGEAPPARKGLRRWTVAKAIVEKQPHVASRKAKAALRPRRMLSAAARPVWVGTRTPSARGPLDLELDLEAHRRHRRRQTHPPNAPAERRILRDARRLEAPWGLGHALAPRPGRGVWRGE